MPSKRNLEPAESSWYESNLIWGPVALILSAISSINHDFRWFLWLAWPCFGFVIWRLSKKTQEPRLVAVLGIAITGGGLLWLGNLLGPKPVSVREDIASSAQPLNRAGTSTSAVLPSTKNLQTESGIAAGTTAKSHRPTAGGALAHSFPSLMPTKKPQPRILSDVALTLAGKIRKLSQDWSTKQSKIDDATDVTDQQRKLMTRTWADKVMAEYDSKYKVDARIVHDKLLAELPPATEGLAMNDDYENEVNPGLLEIIASDLEHLAKLLPAEDNHSPREPQTSISAPNGIAIGGGNVTNPTVNNYAPPQRQIPTPIADALILALKQYPGEAHLNSDSGDFEANTLARQFFSIFVAAGWHPIEIGTLMGGSALPQQIQIGYRGTAGIAGQMGSIPDDQPAARAVVQALFRSGFKMVTITPNPKDKANVLSISIGHNAETHAAH